MLTSEVTCRLFPKIVGAAKLLGQTSCSLGRCCGSSANRKVWQRTKRVHIYMSRDLHHIFCRFTCCAMPASSSALAFWSSLARATC